jgi:hypothetical protein
MKDGQAELKGWVALTWVLGYYMHYMLRAVRDCCEFANWTQDQGIRDKTPQQQSVQPQKKNAQNNGNCCTRNRVD